MADEYIFEYGDDGGLFGDSFDIIIPVGDNLGEYYLPQVHVTGYGSMPDTIIGDIVLSQPWVLGSVGFTISGEGFLELPQIQIDALALKNEYNLPQVSIVGHAGAQSDTNTGTAADLESGYNLPQVEVAGTASLTYCYGDVELPQVKINIVDLDYDGEEDDLIWVDTDGDGEPDTGFYSPVHVDTDGDGIPDTWMESNFQGSIELVGTGVYNLKQIIVNGYYFPEGVYILPQVQISGTMEMDVMMNIQIDVPMPEVVGSISAENPFGGVIHIPLPKVVATGGYTRAGDGVVNVPLPRVEATGLTTPPNDAEAIINVPKPIVWGVIDSTVEETELTFGDTPQCTQ